ncbi:hypothetical protein T03_13635 [Trichinella britovi]|uniref:Uncharacterized protein n=1 Tax=Trichinella britovi TaxID=45882 RepID=A0A0V1APD6_TRIBR|nr:hypothetical protein T03_13635 [Trichinella britovi]
MKSNINGNNYLMVVILLKLNTSKIKKLPPEEEAIEQKRFVMQWEFYKDHFKSLLLFCLR